MLEIGMYEVIIMCVKHHIIVVTCLRLVASLRGTSHWEYLTISNIYIVHPSPYLCEI